MVDSDLKMLQRLGEDLAYTFKGLYKEADWLDAKYRIYLSIPIIFSIVSLGFDEEIPLLWLKSLAVASLIFTMFALIEQKRFEKVKAYRVLADEVKVIYDEAEAAFHRNQAENYDSISQRWVEIRKSLNEHPIGYVGRRNSRKKIRKEMDLSWLGEKSS